VLLFFAAIPFVLSGCGPEEAAEAEANANPEPPPVNVSAIRLKPETLEDEVRLAGRLEPWVEVQVSTELGGTVQEIGFEKGRRVAKGRVLARVGTDLLQAALAEAKAALGHAEAEYNKVTELFDREAVPRQDLTAATSNYHAEQARVEQARLRVERSIIRAPISGIAISREIELGEFLPAGTLVTTIHQVSRLKAVIGIPEDDISYFDVGAKASIEVDAYPEREFTGALQFLSPAATGQNRTFPGEISIENPDGDLRPGMIVRVYLTKQVFEGVIVVPRDAVLERDTGYVAFVYRDGRAELRNVKTGPSEGDDIVVLEGLKPGDELIVTGHRNLVQGQPVRSVNEAL